MSNRPKPTALKILQGNPGKRPLNKNEPKPERPKRIPTIPNHLRGAARYEWQRVCRELYDLGLLTTLDRAALAMYCSAYGTYAHAQKKIDELGDIYKTPKGAVVQNPYLGIRNRAIDQTLRLMVEFGMTPSARSRMSIGKESDSGMDEVDEMNAWRGRAEQARKAKKAENE